MKQEQVKSDMQDQVSQLDMREYLKDESKFSAYDERGVPTHDISGKPLDDAAKRKAEAKFSKLARLVGKFKA